MSLTTNPPLSRLVIVEALNKILSKGIKPKDAIDELSGDLDKRDRAFIMEVVYGVLRYKNYIDWMLKSFLKKPSRLSLFTLNNLRSAIYQIKYMRVPEWATVNEAVRLEKFNKKALVNAVLRNFLRHKEEISIPSGLSLAELKKVGFSPIEYISILTSHPPWLVKRWIKRFGYEEALELAKANNKIPQLTLRVSDEAERDRILQKFIEKKIDAYPTKFSPTGIVLKGSFSTIRSELSTYKLFVQDEASQLITYLLNPLPSERILDACAAPGGKATHIAQLMKNSGEVVAVEADEKRIKQIKDNVSRLGLKSIKIIHADVRHLDDIGQFDKILLDAPCSSIGVIRRNPDIKYRHSESSLSRFKENQIAIFGSLVRFLKPGGIIVYSVCSTEPEEAEEVVKEFLHNNPNFSIIKGDYGFLSHFESLDKDGHLFYRTFPHLHEMDGFFAVRLKKIK